jgi:hypothetical protein
VAGEGGGGGSELNHHSAFMLAKAPATLARQVMLLHHLHQHKGRAALVGVGVSNSTAAVSDGTKRLHTYTARQQDHYFECVRMVVRVLCCCASSSPTSIYNPQQQQAATRYLTTLY